MLIRSTAVAAIALCGCGTPSSSGCPSGVLIVTEAADYSASGVGVLPLDGTPAQLLFGSNLGGDPALATSAGRHFYIARDLDTIFEIDACGRGINEYSARAPGETGPTDPQDVAVASDGTLWVARFDVPSLLVLGSPITTIDMSAFDSDGNPDMSSVRILGGKAFVALERLTLQPDKTFLSQQPSQIAVLDTQTLALVTTVTLAGRNPFGLMVEQNGKLWLSDLGNIDDPPQADAGIEVFDTQTNTSTMLLSGVALGGTVVQVAVNGTCGAAIIANDVPSVNNTSLVSFSIDGSNLATALPPTTGYTLRGLLWTPDGRLLLGDKTVFAVHTFTATASCVLTQGGDLPLPTMPALAFAE